MSGYPVVLILGSAALALALETLGTGGVRGPVTARRLLVPLFATDIWWRKALLALAPLVALLGGAVAGLSVSPERATILAAACVILEQFGAFVGRFGGMIMYRWYDK